MTMIFVLATAGAVFAAGDSRQFPTLAEDRQKVYLVGNDALIAEGGVGVIPDAGPNGEPWDALAELKQIARDTQMGPFAEQLDAITKKYTVSFGGALSRFSEVIRTDPPSKITLFFVKRDAESRVYVAIRDFDVRSLPLGDGKWRHYLELVAPQVKSNGAILAPDQIQAYWTVPPGCTVNVAAAPPIPKENIAGWIRDLMRSVASQSPQCAAQIGGPILVATVDANGARWLPENN